MQGTSYMFPPLRRNTAEKDWNGRLSAEEAAYQSARMNCLLNGEDYFLEQMKNRSPMSLPGESAEDCPGLPIEGEGIRCRAGKCSFWITWDGRMLPCGMFSGQEADNVFETGFSAAWANVRKTAAAIRMPLKCSKCHMRDKCKVCAAMCITETGRFDQVPEYRCSMMQSFEGASRRLEEQIINGRRR